MNAQEALEIIKDELQFTSGVIEDALGLVKHCVNKQIPKKPLDICTPVVTWGICPTCRGELNKIGKQINRVFKTNAYCMDCGQALDWSVK